MTTARAHPRISVAVPTCNRAALLHQCLASLLTQTVRDVELIVVDNASDDETREVVASLAGDRIRYVRNATDIGSRANWNRGLELTAGDYVALCHDDDVYRPTFLAECAAFLDRHPTAGFVHCDAFITDPAGVPIGRFRAYPDDRLLPSADAFRRYLLDSHDVVLSSVMARRSAYAAVGPFQTEYLCADYDMWLRLAARFDVGYIGRPLVYYRTHPESAAQSMPAARWYAEHRAIVEQALRREAGRSDVPSPAVVHDRVRRRWVDRYVREAAARSARGDGERAAEYLAAAEALAGGLALKIRLVRRLTALSRPPLAALRWLRRALRRPGEGPAWPRLALYVSYDGAMEPLGQSQILPYLRGLARSGIGFVLLTFEKPADLARRHDVARLRSELATAGIHWIALRYHKRPSVPATAWDVARGAIVARGILRRAGVAVIHCRSYVATLIGLTARRGRPARLIFDMRGFWPEERVDGGLWPAGGILFRAAKRVERALLAKSDAIVVLTEQARTILGQAPYRRWIRPATPIEVVPCCVDVHKFPAAADRTRGGDEASRVIVYAGSVGTWYMLDRMLEFFAGIQAMDPRLRLLVLNRGEHDVIKAAIAARRLDGVAVRAAAPVEVPGHLADAYAGIYFIRPVFSKRGASPTKLGEYLAAGLPVVVNAGIGDADALVQRHRVGVVIDRLDADAYREKWKELTGLVDGDPALRSRCRQVARDHLGLDRGVTRYGRLYRDLLGGYAVRIGS